MAKAKKLALKFGHATAFRRTVGEGDQKKLLVFEPNTTYEVAAADCKYLAKEIDSGLLVDPDSERRYANAPKGDAEAVAGEIAGLKQQIAERDAKIAELEKQIEDYDQLIESEGEEDDTDE